jgi:hypothetical protein
VEIGRKKHQIALCGEVGVVESVDLSGGLL